MKSNRILQLTVILILVGFLIPSVLGKDYDFTERGSEAAENHKIYGVGTVTFEEIEYPSTLKMIAKVELNSEGNYEGTAKLVIRFVNSDDFRKLVINDIPFFVFINADNPLLTEFRLTLSGEELSITPTTIIRNGIIADFNKAASLSGRKGILDFTVLIR